MPDPSCHNTRPVFTSLSKASFGVAGLAFVGSFACAAINHSLSGWMAVAGMAGLGLFYLALGVLNLGTKASMSISEHEGKPRTRPSDFQMAYYHDITVSDDDSTASQDGVSSRRNPSPQDKMVEV